MWFPISKRNASGRTAICPQSAAARLRPALSYQHAKETARQRLFAESSVRENAFGPTYYYPTDWQIQLINNLKMAKLEPAQKIVGELKIENERMQVSADGMAALLYALRDTVCRVAGEMGMGDWKERTEAQLGGELEDEAPFSWEWIDAACRVLCARSTYQAGTTDLGLHMVQYVDAHYMESAMSLKEVAALSCVVKIGTMIRIEED